MIFFVNWKEKKNDRNTWAIFAISYDFIYVVASDAHAIQ